MKTAKTIGLVAAVLLMGAGSFIAGPWVAMMQLPFACLGGVMVGEKIGQVWFPEDSLAQTGE